MKQRNHAFDLLCGLCIVRMISLHVMVFCGHGQDGWWETLMSWTFFFMSFFFFKAGYFNKSLAGDTRTYVTDKAKRLLVPYLAAGTIGNVIYFAFLPFLLERYKKPIEPLAWEHIWENSAFYGNLPTWFLFSFFAAYVVAHLLEKVRHLHWVVLLFPALSYWLFTLGNPLWMSFNNVFFGVYFFFLGRVWCVLQKRLGERRTLWVSALLVLFFIVGNILWHGEYTMSTNRFEGPPLAIVLNATAVLCGLAGLLTTLRVPRLPIINYIGEHSMVYFISHYPMLYFYKFTHLCYGRSIFGRVDDIIILLPSIFMICSWLVPYVERMPWLSGRWGAPKDSQTKPSYTS